MTSPPTGFSLHKRASPLTEPWGPIFSKQTDKAVILGVYAGEQHCNSRGFVHGGLISALSDNALGLSCAKYYPQLSGLITISLHIDFHGAVKCGQWLSFETDFVKAGRSIGFTQGFISADGRRCANTMATFKVLV